MPRVVAEAWVPVAPEVAFAVSQTTGEVRLRWDPFVRAQHLVDAEVPAKGVRTVTRARLGPRMVSQYASYRPPTSVGMTMVEGPWFFDSFGGGWRFTPEDRDGVAGTRAVWKYTYAIRPGWLRPVAEPIGQWLLGREIRTRIAAWARACEDPVVLRAATAR
ncbi:SRPBCC family protein [Nocardioides panacisoli]|uniref:SRPBCC family protein n=1 Tax=Nocardioides panacisoli TaxID=627624 RepID=UPI001C63859A|nr:SRPBCC family protein [Nocardioides panacisoli]QYJ03213.1 SRPBCC family protein [Nocardioides panacisoli]